MSHRAFCWVLTQQADRDIPPAQFAMLVRLAYYADSDGGNIFPSPETLAAESKVSERRVQEHLAWLVKHGVIEVVKRGSKGRTTTRYAMPIPIDYVVGRADDIAPRNARSRGSEPPETRDSAPRNARSRAGETRNLAPEPTTRTNYKNITTSDSVPSSAAVDPVKDQAEAIASTWWKSFDPRPTSGSYPGYRQIVERLLRAGWPPGAVACAARDCGRTMTIPRMELAMAKSHRRVGPYENTDGSTSRTVTAAEFFGDSPSEGEA